ncbi:hypothetical protein BAC1_00538 [uncultured bacterium]|nr:hypothetical protein BAC1_00538 [uncultured bacterium]
MEPVLRGAAMYFFLLIVIRVAGKRTLAEVTTFDLVLLLIIGESTQQALIGNDFSFTNAFILIITLILIDIGLSIIKQRSGRLDKWIEGTPVIIMKDGAPLTETLRKARIDETDILEAARKLQGLERLEQIKYAILEKDGGITIVPKDEYR